MSASKYDIHECIGRGNFGDVYRAIVRGETEVVAIKTVNLDSSEEDISVLVQEIQLLSRMRSPYITRYFEAFVTNVSMWIVMEYCGGGSCSDLLKCHKKLDEDVVAYIIRGTMSGLKYLHNQGKVHRDVKSANILLTEKGEVKLADFGVSGEITMTHIKRNTFVGTPFWMAPEVIKRRNGGYDQKADIWSIGITTIELVTGTPPLSEFDPLKILFQIPENQPPILEGNEYGSNLKDFIRYCLRKEPEERPTAKMLLYHRYLKNRRGGINLVQLIQEKNVWFEKKYSRGKKPRHSIEEQKQPYHRKISWDFETQRSPRIGTSASPMETTISPLTNMSPNMSNTTASTPVTGSPNKLVAKNYLEDIIIICLGRVANRAKSIETKRTVEMLARNFVVYESQQPGICEAVVEEICIHVHQMMANETKS
ncbi:sporulation-specific protein 1 [[Candida] anglica]|uniref:non-specific serine/threonine protein kinase n=1 Tax=[Candida] anglica TaxID=148631 RepID=A0ABP0EDD6_9ASCO